MQHNIANICYFSTFSQSFNNIIHRFPVCIPQIFYRTRKNDQRDRREGEKLLLFVRAFGHKSKHVTDPWMTSLVWATGSEKRGKMPSDDADELLQYDGRQFKQKNPRSKMQTKTKTKTKMKKSRGRQTIGHTKKK